MKFIEHLKIDLANRVQVQAVPFAAPVVAEDVFEDRIESDGPPQPPGELMRPKLELRSVFPENWLFTLEQIQDNQLIR